MNLITRITLVFAFTSLIIFLAGGVITYRVMEREIDFEQERFLFERLDQVRSFLERREPNDTIRRNKLVIIPLDSLAEESAPEIMDTLVIHSTLERLEPHLKMRVRERVNGRVYEIEMFDVIVESDDIVEGVTEALFKTYLILLGALIIIGFTASYILLKPFRNTLTYIKGFSLKESSDPAQLPSSSLPEFSKLNEFLNQMVSKMVKDYQTLKEFSENASHELKTPLAIIQGKLEIVMNDESLTEEQAVHLSSVQNTVRRLSKLSNSLLLLTKIDNNEFSKIEKVDLSATLNRMINDFQELTELKNISLSSDIEKGVWVQSDKTLIEVLLSNLIINAIRHNIENGEIAISLDKKRLVIYNTGREIKIDSQTLFERFKKSNQSDQSLGLGLAIVKKVCDFSNFSISYKHNFEHHTISISLGPC